MTIDAFLPLFIEHGYQWVKEQQAVHRPLARMLSDVERLEYAQFFDSRTLDLVRVRIVPAIQNPGFYQVFRPLLQNLGIPELDFSTMAGITFVDTILLSQWQMLSDVRPLLFHELVHVVQYETLGAQAFVERYVHGWATNGFHYHAIPLERDAYELQARYEANPCLAFSVIEEVRRKLGST